MKIYIGFNETGMYVTASQWTMEANAKEFVCIQEWEVKTQGKNFHKWSKGKYIKDERKKEGAK